MRKPGIAIICFALLLCSCSKETIYSYYLKGNWTITQLEVKESTDTLSSSYTLSNAGTYSFHKNNEGSVTTSADTSSKTLAFKWSAVSNEKVLLTFENQSTEAWTVLSDEPKNQTWETTITDTLSAGGTEVINTVYKKMFLKKID